MLTTDPFRETPLVLKQHRPLALQLEIRHRDDTLFDLTGCILRLVISKLRRDGGDVMVTSVATIDDPLIGLSRFDIQGDELTFEPGPYELAITLVSAEGFETSIIEGPIEVTWNPDPVVPADYTAVSPPLGLTAKLLKQNRVLVKISHVPGPRGFKGDTGAVGPVGPAAIEIVHHGTDDGVPRPAAPLVYWIGTAYPLNALSYDIRSDS
jgi:hypothetical protein